LWKYKHKTKEVTRDKCIPLGIKKNNVSPKFIIPIENTTLKDHIRTKVRKYWTLITMEHMETKEIHNYAINLNNW
jgi:hypothetical protein